MVLKGLHATLTQLDTMLKMGKTCNIFSTKDSKMDILSCWIESNYISNKCSII